MRLILTRHGETVENVNEVLHGQMPGTLSEKGVEQAKSLALNLKGEKIDCIFCSDLKRSVDTANEVKVFHPDSKIVFVEGLREVYLGSFTGKKFQDIDWSNRPKEIETRQSMCDRVRLVLEKAFSDYPNGRVLFVGHAGTNKAIISVLENKPASYMGEINIQGNAAFDVFEIVSYKNNVFELG